MYKLGFDLSSIQDPGGRKHGGGEYALALLIELLGCAKPREIVGFLRGDWAVPVDLDVVLKSGVIDVISADSERALRAEALQAPIRTFYSALPEFRGFSALLPEKFNIVVTQHGLRDLECPIDRNYFFYANSLRGLLKGLAKIVFRRTYLNRRWKYYEREMRTVGPLKTVIVPSNHTLFSIKSMFPFATIPSFKVLYAPETQISRAVPDENALSEFGLDAEGYVLLVSGGRWEKNAYRAICSIAEGIQSQAELSKLKIAVAGGVPKYLPSKYRNLLCVLPYVSDTQLAALYRNAFAFVYPTLNEGFGYPPLEAMSHGAPVIASCVTAVPEVSGNGADYFDPRSKDEVLIRLLRIWHDREYRAELVARGSERISEVRVRQQSDLQLLARMLLDDPH